MKAVKEMKNSDYWKLRFQQLEQVQNGQGVVAFTEIEKQYKEAQKQIEGEISCWYQRFANNNKISLADARKYLKDSDLKELKWDVQDYIKYGEENALTGKWLKELENASAKFHISRLEALKLQIQQSMEVLFSKQHQTMQRTLADVFKSTYYHTAYELQHGFKIGWDIAGLDQAQIEKVLLKPWAVDGYNFSERIWKNKEKLISEVYNELTRNIMLGADPQKAIDSLAKKMNTSKRNAGRLIMTEEAYFSSIAQKECFDNLDVEQYEIVATLDSHTSDICRSLDGKVFPMKDFQPGVTAPPFHVYCRSTTVPYFDENFGDIGERAARNEEIGKTYYVPANMTYQEWEEAFVDGDKSELQEVENTLNDDIIELTEEERGTLIHYKSFESYVINDVLRNTDDITLLSKEQQEFVNLLDKALSKIPKYKGDLIRTVNFSAWPDSEERTKKFVAEFVSNKKICIPQYWSTSTKRGYDDEADIFIYIQNAKNGHDIRTIGLDENEVLYERNNEFKVMAKVFKDNKWHILLEEW